MADLQKSLEELVRLYLDAPSTHEQEVRFGTKRQQSITRIDFDNVIKKLLSSGFITDTIPSTTLKMNMEYTDSKTGDLKIGTKRAEIKGLENIQKYCRTNSLIDPQKALDIFSIAVP